MSEVEFRSKYAKGSHRVPYLLFYVKNEKVVLDNPKEETVSSVVGMSDLDYVPEQLSVKFLSENFNREEAIFDNLKEETISPVVEMSDLDLASEQSSVKPLSENFNPVCLSDKCPTYLLAESLVLRR